MLSRAATWLSTHGMEKFWSRTDLSCRAGGRYGGRHAISCADHRFVRLTPLAHLGHQRDHHPPDPAAGPVRLPARPDAAADQPGLHPQRDRRDDGNAARAGPGLARPRLLRLGEPRLRGRHPIVAQSRRIPSPEPRRAGARCRSPLIGGRSFAGPMRPIGGAGCLRGCSFVASSSGGQILPLAPGSLGGTAWQGSSQPWKGQVRDAWKR
jgi:hypothetical protein